MIEMRSPTDATSDANQFAVGTIAHLAQNRIVGPQVDNLRRFFLFHRP